MTESLLEKFNKGIHNDIRYTQEELQTLEKMSVEDIDDIHKIGYVELIKHIGDSILWFTIRQPATAAANLFRKTFPSTVESEIRPVIESGLVVLSDFEKKLDEEIESVDTGRNAIEYARRAVLRARLRKQTKDIVQLGAKQIEYIASGTETAVEPFIDTIEHPLAESAVALIDHISDEGFRTTQRLVEGVGETAIGTLETIKNIPSNISNYAKNAYDRLPNVSLYSSSFWAFVDSASDFFYVACALILLGKFDFLLKNTYLVALVAVIIVYTIHNT